MFGSFGATNFKEIHEKHRDLCDPSGFPLCLNQLFGQIVKSEVYNVPGFWRKNADESVKENVIKSIHEGGASFTLKLPIGGLNDNDSKLVRIFYFFFNLLYSNICI